MANGLGDKIKQFTSDGSFIHSWGSSGSEKGQFNYPQGIAITTDGQRIYVADTRNARIQQFSTTGDFINQWEIEDSIGEFEGPLGIAIAADGSAYVTDDYNGRVQQFSANGSFIREWGGEGLDLGFHSSERGIAIAPDGRILVTDEKGKRQCH